MSLILLLQLPLEFLAKDIHAAPGEFVVQVGYNEVEGYLDFKLHNCFTVAYGLRGFFLSRVVLAECESSKAAGGKLGLSRETLSGGWGGVKSAGDRENVCPTGVSLLDP